MSTSTITKIVINTIDTKTLSSSLLQLTNNVDIAENYSDVCDKNLSVEERLYVIETLKLIIGDLPTMLISDFASFWCMGSPRWIRHPKLCIDLRNNGERYLRSENPYGKYEIETVNFNDIKMPDKGLRWSIEIENQKIKYDGLNFFWVKSSNLEVLDISYPHMMFIVNVYEKGGLFYDHISYDGKEIKGIKFLNVLERILENHLCFLNGNSFHNITLIKSSVWVGGGSTKETSFGNFNPSIGYISEEKKIGNSDLDLIEIKTISEKIDENLFKIRSLVCDTRTMIKERFSVYSRSSIKPSWSSECTEVLDVETTLELLKTSLLNRSFSSAPIHIQETIDEVIFEDSISPNILVSPIKNEIMVIFEEEKSEELKKAESILLENEKLCHELSEEERSLAVLQLKERDLLLTKSDTYIWNSYSKSERKKICNDLSEVSTQIRVILTGRRIGFKSMLKSARDMIESQREIINDLKKSKITTLKKKNVFSIQKFDKSIESKGQAIKKALADDDLINRSTHPRSEKMRELVSYLRNTSDYMLERARKIREQTREDNDQYYNLSMKDYQRDATNPLYLARVKYFGMLRHQFDSTSDDKLFSSFVKDMGYDYHKIFDLNSASTYLSERHNFNKFRRISAAVDLFRAYAEVTGDVLNEDFMTYENLCLALGVKKWYMPIRAFKSESLTWLDVYQHEKLPGTNPKRWSI